MSNINEILAKLQKELKAPKNQYNNFGKYSYRSCEDIVEAVKKELPDGVSLVLDDEVVAIGNRVYVKSTAELHTNGSHVHATGWARESETKKGMDDAQITGSASSYARKYALNGLFAIDDTKDEDTNESKKEAKAKAEKYDKETVDTRWTEGFINAFKTITTVEELEECWKSRESKLSEFNKVTKDACLDLYNAKKKELE